MKEMTDIVDKLDPATKNVFLGFLFMALVVLFLMKKKDDWTASLKKEVKSDFEAMWEEKKKGLESEVRELKDRVSVLEHSVTTARGLTFEAMSIAGEIVDQELRYRILAALRKLQEILG